MRKFALLATATVVVTIATPAHARKVTVSPYIDASQVVNADLSGGGDVLTYTSVGAGIDASVQTRRVEVAVSYKYEHRFAWDKPLTQDSVHSGMARAAVKVAPGVTIEAGALATRARSDIRGDAPALQDGNARNLSQVYSAYAGPTVATRVGPGSLNAAYRFGYTKAISPGATGVPAGQPVRDVFDSSTQHMATVSVGVKAGEVLPVGLSVSGAWNRQDASQLDHRFEGKYGRADAVLPVARGVSVVGGVGFEKIQASERDPLRVGGVPVRDSNGRFVTDPASPRRLAYNIEGVFWDAGVIYRPSPRMMLEARVGKRYDSWSYTGSLSYQIGQRSGLQVGVYDTVQTFAGSLTNALAAMPTSFNSQNGAMGNQYNGCVFADGGGAAGGCLNGPLQSVATSVFRARGVDAVLAMNSGPARYGLGIGYANREFYAPSGLGSTNGVTDQSFYGQLFASLAMGPNTGFSGNVYANYFDSGVAGAPAILGAGANGSIYHNFGPVNATASIGIYSFDQQGVGNSLSAQALLGLRYGF